MSAPYLVVSDVHFHKWSAFGARDADGISTRLKIILNELDRAAEALEKAGGRDIVIAGDTFHVRGSIDPEVFNPVHEAIQALTLRGFRFVAIPGNHDLASKETTELGNAIQSLNALDGFTVYTTPTKTFVAGGQKMLLMPWVSTNDGLRAEIEKVKAAHGAEIAEVDLVMHAGINGVLIGLPDHGLDAAEVASWGFKRVLSGHYHHHKVFEDGKVISIGATTAQTWSDVGTKAGFILVYPDRIEWQASHAPSFVEVTEETSEEELPLIVDGNYVRVRGKSASDSEINDMRRDFLALGAKGFSYQGVREVVSARAGAGATHKAVSLEASVSEFIKTRSLTPEDEAAVSRSALEVLAAVRAKAE